MNVIIVTWRTIDNDKDSHNIDYWNIWVNFIIVNIETWRTIDSNEDIVILIIKTFGVNYLFVWWIFNMNIVNIILPRHPGLSLSLSLSLINNGLVNSISNIVWFHSLHKNSVSSSYKLHSLIPLVHYQVFKHCCHLCPNTIYTP